MNVSDGANTAHIALEGQYTTAGFEGAYDQGSGTAVTYDTAHANEHFDQLVLGGVDYSFIEGDEIDLSALLDIATGKDVTDYVEVAKNGTDITVRVDLTGGGSFESGASEVCTLTGIGTDGADPLSILIDGDNHLFTV